MFRFKDQPNRNNYFRYDKKIVRDKTWASLPSASQAIFPVICCHCNKQGLAHPSELTIAILAGCTEKTVREGIKGLKILSYFHIDSYTTSKGHRAYKYQIDFPPPEKGRFFPFHKMIIDGGNWSMLTPTAKALYPVLRTFGYFDLDDYLLRKSVADSSDFKSLFKSRQYDSTDADPDILAEYAGICDRSLDAALLNLEKLNLVEYVVPSNEREFFKVFLRPIKYLNPGQLNELIFKRYKYANEVIDRNTDENITPKVFMK
jgi:hypothetical protein